MVFLQPLIIVNWKFLNFKKISSIQKYIEHFKNLTLNEVELDNNLNLGKIKLELDYESLGEVEIIAEETTVEVKLDKKIYTVGRDLSVRGGNAGDVLDNIPSVSVLSLIHI